jgi:hypothetical protein
LKIRNIKEENRVSAKKYLLTLVTIFILVVGSLLFTMPVLAATTADITVTATPAFVGISCNGTSYNFGIVVASSTTNSSTSQWLITNSSTVVTNHTISVLSANWTGGYGWGHDDTATPGADVAGLLANKGGSWGTGDVIVRYTATLNKIATNQAATTNYNFGLELVAPTSYSDGTAKTIVVRIIATAA